ncbi:hypothetical protein BVY03_05795, partial [bacterium K02(2017)]
EDSSGNRIGTDGDGTSDVLERNVISGNTKSGILVQNSPSTGNTIAGNYIGVGADGSGDQGNGTHGIWLLNSAADNTIGGASNNTVNVIAYNGDAASEYGVFVDDAATDQNRILRNQFFSNQNEGIKLAGDGANDDKVAPGIVAQYSNGASLNIAGTTEFPSDLIQLFDASADNEGETYLGEDTADANGNWTITISAPYISASNVLVATAQSTLNNSSEFSISPFTLVAAEDAPLAPENVGPSVYVGGSNSFEPKPVLSFVLDETGANNLAYQIQIDDDEDYSSPVVDYTSALQVQGAATFTVGQAEGSGSYTIGYQHLSLYYAGYYWRVRAIDEDGNKSDYKNALGASPALNIRTLTVTKTNDEDDSTCDLSCSMRDALTVANSATHPQIRVNFDITSCYGSTCTISPGSALPALTKHGVTIDGYSQSGAVANTADWPNSLNGTLHMVIDGVSAGAGAEGIDLDGASNSTIKGLVINNFGGEGIYVHGGGTNIRIEGNYIGVWFEGTSDKGNTGSGVYIDDSSGNYVGTDGDGSGDAAERNLIAGNSAYGIRASGTTTQISGNFIGVTYEGSVAISSGGDGIYIDSSYNIIGTDNDGGVDSTEGNIISSHVGSGIYITGAAATANTIAGNYIGVGFDGSLDLGNGLHGIWILNAANDNTIGGIASDTVNIVAHNGNA